MMANNARDDEGWLSPQIRAQIKESEAGERQSYESVDAMLAHLRQTVRSEDDR